MNDYLNILKEYDEIKSNYVSIKNDFDIFERYINHFTKAIISLKQCLIYNESIKDNSLFFFVEKYKDLIDNIEQLINVENENLVSPLINVVDNQNIQMKKILNSYEIIKKELFEGKLKLNNARKEYIEILKEDNKIDETKNDKENNINIDKYDNSLLYDTKKDSCFTLYKYQLEKLNEKIDNSNEKYKVLKPELDSIHIVKENTYKIIILKFAKMIGNIGNIFIDFKKALDEKLFKILDENTHTTKYNESENDKVKERFKKEKLETKEELELIHKEKNKDEINIINNNNIKINEENDQNKNEINLNIIKNESKKGIDGLDFEIINEPISSEDPNLIDLIDEIIQKLFSDNEISSTDISQLLENIKFDADFSLKFIKEIKKYSKKSIITLKNRQNFIHISNIFNELIFTKESNCEITNEIIELSQKIKYNEEYITSILRKKNKIISSKNFWMNLIEKNIINDLTEYIKDINKNKPKENKNKKLIEKKPSEKVLNILNNIQLYKKLNKKQKSQVELYSREVVVYLISKAIINMINFNLSHDLIIDIFNYYVENFELGIESYYYFETLLSLKFQKNYLKMNPTHEIIKEKYGHSLDKEQLILLNAAKFLNKKDYIQLFRTKKSIYSTLRKYLMYYQLTYINISLAERTRIWEELLKVDEIKNNNDYKTIKEDYMNKCSQKNFFGSDKEKSLKIVDLDLGRTPIFSVQETHKIKANFILKCAVTLDPDFKYYQGMNYILLFLYQILNYDEEKTFYFFYALLKNTKYFTIFRSDMRDLTIYFKVYEKILEINFPDIYDSLFKKQIMTQFYATQWFITLFNGDAEEFDKEKPPKFLIMAFESFLCWGFSGLINLGISLSYLHKENIINLNSSKLMTYMIKELNTSKNIGDEDFKNVKNMYLKISEKVNGDYFKKLISAIKFEEENPLLKSKQI